jgi:hypothetical protein
MFFMPRRSERTGMQPTRLTMLQDIIEPSQNTKEYSIESAKIIAMTMCHVNNTIRLKNHQFAQTYCLMKGLQKFGQRSIDAAHKEME